MKTLFPQCSLSRKSNTPHIFPYFLIFSLIRAKVGEEYYTTKGVFKNKGLIGNHYMIFISHHLVESGKIRFEIMELKTLFWF